MKYGIKKNECYFCPKCGKYPLWWRICYAEEKLYSAMCPQCGLFFANELSGYEVEDVE